ncbi:MAG: KamA family radical SAM protein [Erysipelotrichales bacterium]
MSWQEELANNTISAIDLKDKMKLSDDQVEKLDEILTHFPMSITKYYLDLCDFDDPNDPILKMAIPSIDETNITDGSFDTSGEASNTIIQGMQHKYQETVMILSSNLCAMYCRHCFRKRLVGLDNDEIANNFNDMAKYVSEHKEISNVLISGGDSFVNSNERIKQMLDLFSEIDHLDFIRFGTRTPVVFPSRIYEDQELLDILSAYNKKKQIYVVTHFNHPKELTSESKRAIKALTDIGISIRNQTVLLKGVNDNPDVLAKLLKDLTINNITPYYIFQCRPVVGVINQFQVPLLDGYEIVQKAKNVQNGFGKNVRYGMSHVTGKIEIVGSIGNNELIFKYHEVKDLEDHGKVFKYKLEDKQAWLDDDFKPLDI